MPKRAIAESELILTKDSKHRLCVYHLGIAPEDIADTIILVGDPGRVAKISKHFSKIEVNTQHREFVTHTGFYQGKRLTVLATGIGADNIDIVLNELDALVNIDFKTRTIKPKLKCLNIVRIGTSGALQADIPLDTFVVGNFGLGLDITLNFYQRKLNNKELALEKAIYKHLGKEALTRVRPYVAEAAHKLVTLFKDKCTVGMTATAPGFFGAQGRTVRCPLTMPNFVNDLASFNYQGHRIANFEMEAAAIYGFARIMGHHACAVNLIIANRAHQTFTKRLDQAMEEMIEMVLNKLTTRKK